MAELARRRFLCGVAPAIVAAATLGPDAAPEIFSLADYSRILDATATDFAKTVDLDVSFLFADGELDEKSNMQKVHIANRSDAFLRRR